MGYSSMTKAQLLAELEARDALDDEVRGINQVLAAVERFIPKPWDTDEIRRRKFRQRQRIFDYIQGRWS